MSEPTKGLRLAFTPGMLGLHFVVGTQKYADEAKGPSDMAYVNSLIEAHEKLPIANLIVDCRGMDECCNNIALIERQQSEIELLRAALKVAQQSLLECRAAQERGPDWYTHGTRGMYQQVAMQLLRGLQAVKDALGPYDENGQYLKEMPACPHDVLHVLDTFPSATFCAKCGERIPEKTATEQDGMLTITRDVTTVSPNFKMTVATVSDVTRGPCSLCGRTDNHTHTAGPFGMS